MQGRFCTIQIFYKRGYSPFIEELVFFFVYKIIYFNFYSSIKKSQFAQPFTQHFKGKYRLLKNFRVGPESDSCSTFVSGGHFLEGGYRFPFFVALLVFFSATPNG